MATTPTLRLGITMAGAVSAGAYTAGVMDYLLETLQRWQHEKENGNPLAPPHDVKIDVLGGTSAGGMSAAIAALSLYHGHQPINDPKQIPANQNLLFDAWVNLFDDAGKDNSFVKMLETSDIQPGGKIASLLNSDFIEAISNRALQRFKKGELPPFVSPDFEVLLTMSNLRGIPFEVNFNSDQAHREVVASHAMMYHKMYAHFKTLGAEDVGDSHFRLDFNRPEDLARIIDFAKTTGAFPIGLKPRQIQQLKSSFVLNTISKFLPPELLEKQLVRLKEGLPDDYAFTAVDGGVFNNEPFTEMAQLLEQRRKKPEGESGDFAMIMIDPFPSFLEGAGAYNLSESIFEVAGGLVSALRNQASYKEADILSLGEANYKRNMIYPVRYVGPGKKADYAIACGALGGFSGFFKREFRVHDYFLGRDNCRNFLRFIFTCAYPLEDGKVVKENLRPIHQVWTDEMIKKFGAKSRDRKTLLLPVIPDFSEFDEVEERKYFDHSIPKFPTIAAADIMKLKPLVNLRANKMVQSLMQQTTAAAPPVAIRSVTEAKALKEKVGKYVGKEFKSGFFERNLISIAKSLFGGSVVDYLASQATQSVLKAIITDFVKKGLIKEEELE